MSINQVVKKMTESALVGQIKQKPFESCIEEENKEIEPVVRVAKRVKTKPQISKNSELGHESISSEEQLSDDYSMSRTHEPAPLPRDLLNHDRDNTSEYIENRRLIPTVIPPIKTNQPQELFYEDAFAIGRHRQFSTERRP